MEPHRTAEVAPAIQHRVDSVRTRLRPGLSVSAVERDLLVLDPSTGTITQLAIGDAELPDILDTLASCGFLDAEHTTGLSRRTLLAGAAAGAIGVTVLTLPSAAAAASTSSANTVPTAVPAGETWVLRSTDADIDAIQWRSVTYGTVDGNPLFVAVGYSGTGERVMTSPDGITWTQYSSTNDSVYWHSVTYGSGTFVATGEIAGTVESRTMYSTDGENWTSAGVTTNTWIAVTYGTVDGSGRFVAVALNGTNDRAMTSTDGTSWTLHAAPTDPDTGVGILWTSVTYGGGLFVAVARSSVGWRVMTSPDGETWTLRNSAADHWWTDVTYGDGKFVAVSTSGSVMTSPDGINWTLQTTPTPARAFLSVTYGGPAGSEVFVAVASNGTGQRVMTSPDGITWTLRDSPSASTWYGVTYGDGQFVAVASAGDDRVMTSTDGT